MVIKIEVYYELEISKFYCPDEVTWPLYLGELLTSRKLKHHDFQYSHFHTQCNCGACIAWTKDEIYNSIINKIPFKPMTGIIYGIETVNVKVSETLWEFCYDLTEDYIPKEPLIFSINTTNFILRYRDLSKIRKEILSHEFILEGGNSTTFAVHRHDTTLNIEIDSPIDTKFIKVDDFVPTLARVIDSPIDSKFIEPDDFIYTLLSK